jgi:hypothetical protein
VNDDPLRRLLVEAVPQIPAPPDRLARVGRLVRARRRRRMTAVAVAAVAATGLLAVPRLFATNTQPPVPAGPVVTVSTAPSTSDSASPTATPSGQPGTPPASPGPARAPGVAYDPGRIPAGSPGSGQVRVSRTGELPSPDASGWFRTLCLYSHMRPDDPVRQPNRPGAAPLTMYWGNTAAGAASTGPSLLGGGNSTCRGGIADRSAYYMSAVIDTRTGTPIAPDEVHVFYSSGSDRRIRPNQVRELPAGLRMVTEVGRWSCWTIGSSIQPTIPTACPANGHIAYEAVFPRCWDGRNLDSADHRSHVVSLVDGACPPHHPVVLPEISYHALYPVAGSQPQTWRLSTDNYPADQPAGRGIAAGYIEGWAAELRTTWTDVCVRRPVSCGSHLLGDGRVIQGDR